MCFDFPNTPINMFDCIYMYHEVDNNYVIVIKDGLTITY